MTTLTTYFPESNDEIAANAAHVSANLPDGFYTYEPMNCTAIGPFATRELAQAFVDMCNSLIDPDYPVVAMSRADVIDHGGEYLNYSTIEDARSAVISDAVEFHRIDTAARG